MSTEVNDARQQAIYKLEGIKEMMARLSHIEKCEGGDDCDSDPSTMCDATGYHFTASLGSDKMQEIISEYHDHDAALEAITESPLSVEVRSNWVTPGTALEDANLACEYQILLCPGGPAVRLVGELGNYSKPETARLEYQDWGAPWTKLWYADIDIDFGTPDSAWLERANEMETVLLSYARQFWFGG